MQDSENNYPKYTGPAKLWLLEYLVVDANIYPTGTFNEY